MSEQNKALIDELTANADSLDAELRKLQGHAQRLASELENTNRSILVHDGALAQARHTIKLIQDKQAPTQE